MPWVAVLIQRVVRCLHGRFTIGAVGVLLDQEQRVLLVEHVFHPKTPWGLPGGWVNRNELPQKAVEREFLEETGLKVIATHPLGVWSSKYLHKHVDMAFAVELDGAQSLIDLKLSDELLNYQWVRYDEAPRLFPEHTRAIDLAVKQRHRPETSRNGMEM